MGRAGVQRCRLPGGWVLFLQLRLQPPGGADAICPLPYEQSWFSERIVITEMIS